MCAWMEAALVAGVSAHVFVAGHAGEQGVAALGGAEDGWGGVEREGGLQGGVHVVGVDGRT